MALDESDKKWISDQLETLETKLLTEFHRFAQENELRLRGHEAALSGREATLRSLENRVDNLADRVAKLERIK